MIACATDCVSRVRAVTDVNLQPRGLRAQECAKGDRSSLAISVSGKRDGYDGDNNCVEDNDDDDFEG